jgi:hypothetical protein
MKLENFAYCGYDCSKCPIFINTENANLNNLKEIKNSLENINNREIPLSDIECRGCKSDTLFEYCKKCNIRKCALSGGFESCSLCNYRNCDKIKTVKRFNKQIYDELDKLADNFK